MSQLILDPVLSGYNLAKVNDNFKRIEEAFNTLLLHKDGSKALTSDLDVNSQKLLNVGGIEIGGVDLLKSIVSLQESYNAYISEMEIYRRAVEGILDEAISYGAVDKKSIGNAQAVFTTNQAYAKNSNLTLPLKYIVGKNALRLSLGHTYLLYKGVDYEEVGVVGEESQTIKILRASGIGVGVTVEQVVDGDNDLIEIFENAQSLYNLLTTNYSPTKVEEFINSVSDVKELRIEDKISELWDIYNNLSALQTNFANTVADINTKYSTITDMYEDVNTKYSVLETLYPQLVALIADTNFDLNGLNAAVADMLIAIQELQALTGTIESNAQTASTAAASASTSAETSSNNASFAANSATRAQIWAEGTDTEVEGILGEHSSKGWAEEAKRYVTGNIIEALGYTPADVDDLNALDDSVVKHTEQTLTSTQQVQARTNIAAASSSELNALSTTVSGKQDALTFDTTPTANSSNPVTSDGIKTALDGKQDTLEFDDAPTEGSTNLVTSGGVKTALDTIQNSLTFDTTPTANSTNPVTSHGILTALNTLSDAQLQALSSAISEIRGTAGSSAVLSDYLPLAGGEMTGNVVVSGRTNTAGGITTVVSSGQYAKGVNPPETEWHILAVAAEAGDYTAADSVEVSNRYGFVETAVNSDGSVYTQIAAVKNLSGNDQQASIRVGWDSAGNAFAEAAGKDVERISEGSLSSAGSGFIRYESGLQICWAYMGLDKNVKAGFSGWFTWTYPKSFKSTWSIFANPRHRWFSTAACDATETSATMYYTNTSSHDSTISGMDMLAIASWQ